MSLEIDLVIIHCSPGGVQLAGCKTEERVLAFGGVLIKTAAVRWRVNRSSRRREGYPADDNEKRGQPLLE